MPNAPHTDPNLTHPANCSLLAPALPLFIRGSKARRVVLGMYILTELFKLISRDIAFRLHTPSCRGDMLDSNFPSEYLVSNIVMHF